MSAEQLKQRDAMQRLTDFLNEVGMLPPYASEWLQVSWGPAKKPVAEHSHRTAVIGYVLAKKDGSGRGPHGHALPLP